MDVACKQCGTCCHYYNEQNKLVKCKMLIKIGAKSICRIYQNRLGHKVAKVNGKDIICIQRKDSKIDFEGCPYNTNKIIRGTQNDCSNNS